MDEIKSYITVFIVFSHFFVLDRNKGASIPVRKIVGIGMVSGPV